MRVCQAHTGGGGFGKRRQARNGGRQGFQYWFLEMKTSIRMQADDRFTQKMEEEFFSWIGRHLVSR